MDHTAATSRKNGSNTIIPKSYSQVTNIQCHLAKTKLNWFNGYLMALVIMGEGHKNKGEKPWCRYKNSMSANQPSPAMIDHIG